LSFASALGTERLGLPAEPGRLLIATRLWLTVARLMNVRRRSWEEQAMRIVWFGTVLLAAAVYMAPPAWAQDCRGCARRATIEACVQCSLKSPDRKATYSEAGIRSWCQSNQPVCSKRKNK
jgi:hypothetical protein